MPAAPSSKSAEPSPAAIAYRVEEDDRLLIFDAHGTLLAEYPWPEPGTKYVGSGNPRGPRGPRKQSGSVRDVLIHQLMLLWCQVACFGASFRRW